MDDITIIFYTSNYENQGFMDVITENLLKSIGDTPLITVSHKPMKLGRNICVGEIGRSHLNIYRQILIGAKAAETPYVALAEDDILYPPSHFRIRPSSMEVFNYDVNKWSLYTWYKPPVFSYLDNTVVHQLICARDYLIGDLEERFAKWPDESTLNLSNWKDPGRRENRLNMTERRIERSMAEEPTIAFSHEDAFGFLNMGKKKAHGELKTTLLEPWGTAEEVLRLYKRRDENQP